MIKKYLKTLLNWFKNKKYLLKMFRFYKLNLKVSIKFSNPKDQTSIFKISFNGTFFT